jgi:hypothetical protein
LRETAKTATEKANIAANLRPVKATGSMSRHAILKRVNVEAHMRATDRRARSISRGGGPRALSTSPRFIGR